MAEVHACQEAVQFVEEIGFRRITVEGVREANAAARGLAQEGKRFETVRYWIEEAPERVEDLVTEDRRRMQKGGNGGLME
ncbi:hypothetical protein V6Z11_A10G156400 [Gossypium hirsutum]